MAPKKAQASRDEGAAPPGLPALERSRICNEEGLEKVRHMAGDRTSEWGPTGLWPGSAGAADLTATAYPFFLHTIAAGLVAPFSPFFRAILEHY